MGKSDRAHSYSFHHTVFLQTQRDSDAKPLSPRITRKELSPTAQENCPDPFSSSGFSNQHLSVWDEDRKSYPSGVCSTMGLWANGGDAGAWNRGHLTYPQCWADSQARPPFWMESFWSSTLSHQRPPHSFESQRWVLCLSPLSSRSPLGLGADLLTYLPATLRHNGCGEEGLGGGNWVP